MSDIRRKMPAGSPWPCGALHVGEGVGENRIDVDALLFITLENQNKA